MEFLLYSQSPHGLQCGCSSEILRSKLEVKIWPVAASSWSCLDYFSDVLQAKVIPVCKCHGVGKQYSDSDSDSGGIPTSDLKHLLVTHCYR